MAQKRYTCERLNGVAADSATKWRTTLQVKDLTCEHVQQDLDVAIKGSDKLRFLWKISSCGYSDQFEIEARCSHVVERGVPFPDRWHTATKAVSLQRQVRESVNHVTEFGISAVKCELIGQAKEVGDDTVGKIIALDDDGNRYRAQGWSLKSDSTLAS